MICRSTTLLISGSKSRGKVRRRELTGITPSMTEHWERWRPYQPLRNGFEFWRTVEIALFVSKIEGLEELLESQRSIAPRESFQWVECLAFPRSSTCPRHALVGRSSVGVDSSAPFARPANEHPVGLFWGHRGDTGACRLCPDGGLKTPIRMANPGAFISSPDDVSLEWIQVHTQPRGGHDGIAQPATRAVGRRPPL